MTSAEIRQSFLDFFRIDRPFRFDNRLWIDAAEKRVVIAIERGDFACCAGQQLFETARAYAEQCVVRETQF